MKLEGRVGMLENEITLTDKQIKMLLTLLDTIYLDNEHRELKEKLESCLYDC